MDPLDDVALLQTAVLQQDLLERDVEEVRKRKKEKTQKISDPSMAGWEMLYGGCMEMPF